ncbi:MAG: alpha-N-arabinofuranosidase [Propionibacteriaceae bacterium]|jgi:alpha-N-arabinofuranosidase|nr:alpha-N-arabinofuranosidase [Propionibacteriaceae bacterium]
MRATITLDPAFIVGPVRPRVFGSFVEHLGRCVYGGIFEPGHPSADASGFRGDVLELTRELGVTMVRYPGGNFVSGYRWEDGVGPVDQRPKRRDLAWHSLEPNQIGVDEFMAWARLAGVEPMMAVNLGTRSVAEALDLLDYCNGPVGSTLADRRLAAGAATPYGVQLWCLGNEMDGPWQTGHKTAHEYGRLAAETGRAMKMMQPGLQLVACGSSSAAMPTFGAWEYEVLTQAYEQVDLISAHAYYCESNGDLASFLASADDMDQFIDAVTAAADAAKAAGKHSKTIGISFDEWNVWYQDRAESQPPQGDDWPVAPVLLEDHYNLADAVVVGDLLIALLRHSDRVEAACLAQLVNVIAPIMTVPGGPAWRQTIFHPFALTARHAKGQVLRLAIDSDCHDTQRFGSVAAIDAVATFDQVDGSLAVFVANRSTDQVGELAVDLSSFGELQLVEALTLHHDDPHFQATPDTQSSEFLGANETVAIEAGRLQASLPACSWSLIRLQIVGR